MVEPTTALTDFLMAAVALVLAARIFGFWRFAFLFTGIGAASGGFYHSRHSEIIWKVTVYSVGLATLFIIAAAASATVSRRTAKILMWIAAVQFIVYAVWMSTHDAFTYVIV